jgi:MFS family permease
MLNKNNFFLPVIVISQFFCTSLWFAGNSVISDIIINHHLEPSFLGNLTSAIQFGFIAGTFAFALYSISDRFSPSKVFFFSSVLAGIFNLGICIDNVSAYQLLTFRFLTGFFLAGIYPVGMKIASDYYNNGLGRSLGFLVSALVLGTAFPHLLKNVIIVMPWKYVLYITTTLSIIGGTTILFFVPNGPYYKKGQKILLSAFMDGFKNHNFRSVSFGYFGHMWELYTFWAFVPLIITSYNSYYPQSNINVSLISFFIIASGSLSCVLSGLLSTYFSTKKIATTSLFLSCLCCLFSPFLLHSSSSFVFLLFLFFWGFVVIADSPLFSTLVAQNAPEESRGTSLTIVNCIGFSITIISIQLINLLIGKIAMQYIFMFLAIGPIMGLYALYDKGSKINSY